MKEKRWNIGIIKVFAKGEREIMRQILITGGSGFLGRHLVQRLLEADENVRVKTISRGENDIQKMLAECPSNCLIPIYGDIKDAAAVEYSLRQVDVVIHLAAMKHIEFCERYPDEAIATNVNATKRMLDLFRGDTFIGMSTDKAVQATNCYGATKLLQETLILNRAREADKARYMIVRSGNIFGSTGSVITRWKQQIKQRNEITVTNLGMTRFFINVETLVTSIIEVMDKGVNGNIYVPYQRALVLADLATAVIDSYGNKATTIKPIDTRPGERINEILFAEGEKVVSCQESRHSEDSPKLSVEEIKAWLTQLENQ